MSLLQYNHSLIHVSDNIPLLPHFRKFIFSDIEWYKTIYEPLAPYADIHYNNLFVWSDLFDTLEVSSVDDVIVFKYSNPLSNKKTSFVVVGHNIHPSTIEKIFAYQKSSGYDTCIEESPVTMYSPEIFSSNSFCITHDRDNYEYIFNTAEQTSLAGRKFSRQRRRIGYFERAHEGDSIKLIYSDVITPNKAMQLKAYIADWGMKIGEVEDDNFERAAIEKSFKLSRRLGKHLLEVEIAGKVKSFCIFFTDREFAGCNHLKVDYSIQYLFDYTTFRLAQWLDQHKIPLMNYEQDLGIVGLRDHKVRMQPVDLLEKVTIMPNDQSQADDT